MKINTSWKGKMTFDAVNNDGHHVTMDAYSSVGGENKAQRPKELLLSGLAGCTGMDVISILKKMKIIPAQFDIEVSADLTDNHPIIFSNIQIKYIFKGNNLPHSKIEKAVKLSQESFCGVTEILRQSATVGYQIINENLTE